MTRTDNDTWDLATGVGMTATAVAAGRAVASSCTPPLIDDPFAAPLVRAVGIDFLNRWVAGEITDTDLAAGELGLGLPQLPVLMAARTRFFDSFFCRAADAGVRQVVILASGLDTRSYRLPWAPQTTVFEIDRPEVLDFKDTTLRHLDAAPRARLHHVGVDLREDWPAALSANGFDPHQPTAWSAEGLLYYLRPADQDRLLDDITALSAPASRLAADPSPSNGAAASSQEHARARRALDRLRDHGFDLDLDNLQYDEPRHDYDSYLTERGWRCTTTQVRDLLTDDDALGARELRASPLTSGTLHSATRN